MNLLENIISLGQFVYNLCEEKQHCKHQCQRLGSRVQGLLQPLKVLQAHGAANLSPQLTAALCHLQTALNQAKRQMETFNNKSEILRFLRARNDMLLFKEVNKRLRDASEELSLLLQAEQRIVVPSSFQRESWQKEDQQDAEEDRGKENIDFLLEQLESIIQTLRQCLRKPMKQLPHEHIREIKKEQLSESPWIELRKSESSVLYKGEYSKCPVAIKVFNNSQSSTELVRSTFNKEIETMKKFESPNILRIFGICIDEKENLPQFCIVMEHCELGTLRELLDREPNLEFGVRIFLSLEAAKGLYRLHEFEEPELHRNITSTNFLVTESYHVKAGSLRGSKRQQRMKGTKSHWVKTALHCCRRSSRSAGPMSPPSGPL
ncbi:mixed lineage kinase domain-like protein isoform X2 [Tenrec ecaudatus]|uniref:mixed lineage kinase domain-like protein isoform X2 n=1 Tax=Tenrec ecaudatus TaxID=94439 RepID=UPI003F593A97